MSRYAGSTPVPSDRSRTEIEKTLRRYGATAFAYAWEANRALIGFELGGRRVRFILPLPDRSAREFRLTPSRGAVRSDEAQEAAYEQAVRQRWRALLLVVKAKLEAVEAGITTLQDEFLAGIVLPDNSTVGDYARPAVERMYETQAMQPMLPVSPALPALGAGKEERR
jgi:hypothetical protein